MDSNNSYVLVAVLTYCHEESGPTPIGRDHGRQRQIGLFIRADNANLYGIEEGPERVYGKECTND